MSSTDARRPHAPRPSAARVARGGAVLLAVTAMLPLAAQTAQAETAPGEPICQDVSAAELGRGDDGRAVIGATGLTLVLHRSAVSVEGDGAITRSVTVVSQDGHESESWGTGTDVRNELNAPTYDHVRVCWEVPVTEQVVVPETTSTTVPWTDLEEPTSVPWTQVDPPTTTPWTDLEEPMSVPWTQVTDRPGTTTTATVPTKRSTAETEWSTILGQTGDQTTPVDRKRQTPTPAQETTAPTTALARPEVPGDVTRAADGTAGSTSDLAATTPVARAATPVARAAAPDRLVQTGAQTMPLLVASTSLVILGGAVLHLSHRTSQRRPARRHGAR